MLPKMQFENNEASYFAGIKCHYDDLFRKLAWEIRKAYLGTPNPSDYFPRET